MKTTSYSIPGGIVHRQIDDEVILINLNTDKLFSLNQTAAFFWLRLAQGRTLVEIRNEMLKEFEVSEMVLDREIETLVAKLIEEGFLLDGTIYI